MPVEIRELVITAVVRGGGDGGDGEEEGGGGDRGGEVDQQALVEACVRQVLSVLRQEKER